MQSTVYPNLSRDNIMVPRSNGSKKQEINEIDNDILSGHFFISSDALKRVNTARKFVFLFLNTQ